MENGSVPYALFIGQTKVAILPEELDQDFDECLVRSLRGAVEGKYVQGSYVRKNSATILQRSRLQCVQGDPRGTVTCTVAYLADRVALQPEDRIVCRIDSINKMGALARAGDHQEVKVYLPRDDYGNAVMLESPDMAVGRRVLVEVMPSPKGAMSDEIVVVLGKVTGIEAQAPGADGALLPAAVRIPLEGGAAAPDGPPTALGDQGPSVAVVPMVGLGPPMEQVMQGILRRVDEAGPRSQQLTLSAALELLTPFAAPGDRARFWWEAVQRTALLKEDLPVSLVLFGGDAEDLARQRHPAEALTVDAARLPGDFHNLLPSDAEPGAVEPVARPPRATAAVVLDPLAGRRDVPLAEVLASEPAWAARLLSAVRALDPSGSLLVVMYPRASRMALDWLGWCMAHFGEVELLRAVAQDPLDPTLVVAFAGYRGASEKEWTGMQKLWKAWRDAAAGGSYVAGLRPSQAPKALLEAWPRLLDRNSRAMVKLVRDAVRLMEDGPPDEDDEIGLERQRREELGRWLEAFRRIEGEPAPSAPGFEAEGGNVA